MTIKIKQLLTVCDLSDPVLPFWTTDGNGNSWLRLPCKMLQEADVQPVTIDLTKIRQVRRPELSTMPRHKIVGSQMLTLAGSEADIQPKVDKMLDWCVRNCAGGYNYNNYEFAFELSSDETLFSLRWKGELCY